MSALPETLFLQTNHCHSAQLCVWEWHPERFWSVPSFYGRWQKKHHLPVFLGITFRVDGRFTHPCQTRDHRVLRKFAAAFISCLEWLLWNSKPYFTALWPPTRHGCNLQAFYNINMMPDSSQVHRLQGWMHMSLDILCSLLKATGNLRMQ